MKHTSGVPACENEAEKLGRGGKFASPAARADLAAIQNQAARAYHAALNVKPALQEKEELCHCGM